jgi:hypothetical protein
MVRKWYVETTILMGKPVLNTDAEEILLYLHKTERHIERTKQAIREACQLADLARTEFALRQLLHSGCITNVNDGEYQVTPSGKQVARALAIINSTHVFNVIENMEGGTVNMTGTQDAAPLDSKALFTAPLTVSGDDEDTAREEIGSTLYTPPGSVPTLYHHPLRLSHALRETPPGRRPTIVLRFVLAFDMPKDALPVPVVHGDVLGRSRSADICLRHDEFVSTRHCRFEVRQESGVFKLYVEDLGSRNGTYIDKARLKENKRYLLKHGSHLQVGSTAFIVVQIP